LSETAGNGQNVYRLASLEKRLDRIDLLEPAVMKSEISDIKESLGVISNEIISMRRLLMGFMATFALSSVTIVVSVATLLTQR
jgi:hypothetical protein